jgi:hypothetical protein
MSRDDWISIYCCLVAKRTKKGMLVYRVAYIVKWIQGDPDCMTNEEFIKIMTGQKYTCSLEKAVKLAHFINADVSESEYGVVLVENYKDVVIPLATIAVSCPYFLDQEDIYMIYREYPKKNLTNALTFTKYGDYSISYKVDRFGQIQLVSDKHKFRVIEPITVIHDYRKEMVKMKIIELEKVLHDLKMAL